MEGVKVKVGVGYWIFIAVAVLMRQSYFALLYTLAVILHEISHYVVASRLFYHCTEIRLGIFGATLYGDFADVNNVDRTKIALAGPICNAILCLVCLSAWWLVPTSYYFTEYFFTANCSMACINLLPCYPLDGGRALTGILEGKCKNALKLVKTFTVALSLLLFAVFVVSLFTNDKLFSVGLFAICLFSGVINSSGGECYVKTTFAFNLDYYKKRGMEKKTLVFFDSCKLGEVAKRMQGNYLYCLEVIDDDMNVVSRYSFSQLERLIIDCDSKTKLKDLPTLT